MSCYEKRICAGNRILASVRVRSEHPVYGNCYHEFLFFIDESFTATEREIIMKFLTNELSK